MSSTKTEPLPDDDALLTSNQVAERYSIHKDTVADYVAQGKIPPPLDGWNGPTKRWLRSEIVAHIRGMRKRELAEQVK